MVYSSYELNLHLPWLGRDLDLVAGSCAMRDFVIKGGACWIEMNLIVDIGKKKMDIPSWCEVKLTIVV